jgi:hypothetical protein
MGRSAPERLKEQAKRIRELMGVLRAGVTGRAGGTLGGGARLMLSLAKRTTSYLYPAMVDWRHMWPLPIVFSSTASTESIDRAICHFRP